MPLFDLARRHQNLIACRPQFDQHRFLIDHVWDQIIDRLNDLQRRFTNPLFLGWRGADRAVQILSAQGKLTGTSPIILDHIPVDEILPITPYSYDLILSVFDGQTLNNPAQFFFQLRHALKPDGVMLMAFPGGTTLATLQSALMQVEAHHTGGAAARIHPMLDLKSLAEWVQSAGFSLPVIDHEKITVTYQEIENLFNDLRGMGERGCLVNRPPTLNPEIIPLTLAHLRGPKGNKSFEIEFEIFYAIGWAPDPSQQKPAARGSGSVHLDQVL